LPVYAVLIAACIPDIRVFGFWKLSGITMLSMYLLGIVVALLMAWLFKKTLLKGPTPMLIMELPPYKQPVPHVVLRHMWDRSKLFLRRAGTVILGINILLWFLATYPRNDAFEKVYTVPERGLRKQIELASSPSELASLKKELAAMEREESGERLRQSFAGRLGRIIEPVIAPLGFDWKMGIGIVASFAAREVFVSTMSTVYNVGEYDKSAAATSSLAKTLQQQKHPDGTLIYTPLVAVTLMVFYVFALQCVSTVAVVRRETNSWNWPIFQWVYMGLLAWSLAFITYHGGRLFGWN
jgi:ferrous iron transport protein B